MPSALAIGALAAVVAIALHFIARSRPLAEPLPTARFIPERRFMRARARSHWLTCRCWSSARGPHAAGGGGCRHRCSWERADASPA